MIGVEAEIESDVIELEASLDYRGPRGPQGIQGIQGEQGIQGIQGIQGEIGPSGVYIGGDEPISDYNVWIDPDGEIVDYITHEDFLKELDKTIASGQKVEKIGENITKQGNYAKEQGDYAKETTDTLKRSVENGDFNGATFIPNVDDEGNLSWINDKDLDNPKTQNIKGPKGEKGDCNFATFSIENGNLVMNKTDDLLLNFGLNERGELEVLI